jgi:hypothetical protein
MGYFPPALAGHSWGIKLRTACKVQELTCSLIKLLLIGDSGRCACMP